MAAYSPRRQRTGRQPTTTFTAVSRFE